MCVLVKECILKIKRTKSWFVWFRRLMSVCLYGRINENTSVSCDSFSRKIEPSNCNVLSFCTAHTHMQRYYGLHRGGTWFDNVLLASSELWALPLSIDTSHAIELIQGSSEPTDEWFPFLNGLPPQTHCISSDSFPEPVVWSDAAAVICVLFINCYGPIKHFHREITAFIVTVVSNIVL